MKVAIHLAVAVSICFSAAWTHVRASDIADAAMYGDSGRIRDLLEQNVDVDEPQVDGATALHWAAYAGDSEIVQLLLGSGANPNVRNREGVSPLLLATMSANAGIIDALLSSGADPNERSVNGETPLMMAARTGQPGPIVVLLDHGAEIDARENLRGTTALMWAAAYANPLATAILLERGADPGIRSATRDRGRRPYLAPTARRRIEEYYEGVGQAGTAIAVDLDGDGVVDVGTQSQATINDGGDDEAEDEAAESFFRASDAEDWGGLTALVFAAREGDYESVSALIAAGADVNQLTEFGWTPLLTATQNRYYRIATLLLEQGADPNIRNNGGWSPLYIATDNRNIEGGDYPTRRPDLDHLAYIELLLEHGADVNLRMASSTETRTIFTHQWLYEDGATPFLRAAQSSDTVLLELFLEHGADPAINTDSGVTPLMVAAGIGWVEGVTFEWSREQNRQTVELLLDLGARVNAQDSVDHRTALMGAAHKGRPEIIQLLVNHGADMSLRDIGSRDSIHALLGVTWQAIDYADGLVRVGVQSAVTQPEASALLRRLMNDAGLEVPPESRTLDSICITDICR